jgi:tripartite-type tricarboxylate transporter receptor subunit TctC
MKRRHLLAAGIGALAAPAAVRANAKFPDHTIRLVVPFPAGGATDVVGRMFADKLT